MPDCKNCPFMKPCEDPFIGDFYCNYSPDEVEMYRWKKINEVVCKRDLDFEPSNKKPPENKPKMKQAINNTIKDHPKKESSYEINPNLIEDPELKEQAIKLIKMQNDLMNQIKKKNHDDAVELAFDKAYHIVSKAYQEFLDGDITLDKNIGIADFLKWSKKNKNGSKKNPLHDIIIGYFIGKRT